MRDFSYPFFFPSLLSFSLFSGKPRGVDPGLLYLRGLLRFLSPRLEKDRDARLEGTYVVPPVLRGSLVAFFGLSGCILNRRED